MPDNDTLRLLKEKAELVAERDRLREALRALMLVTEDAFDETPNEWTKAHQVLNAGRTIQQTRARLSEAVRLGTKNGLENEKLREQLSAAEERAEYERARAGARAEKAADLQAHLSAAEAARDVERDTVAQLLTKLIRAEEVVEAAKKQAKRHAGLDLQDAVRRYEEGKA